MCQIKRTWLPICLTIVLTLGYSNPAVSSTVIPPKDFGELVRMSDLVIVAKAGTGKGYTKGDLILTGTRFTVMDVVKGATLIGSDIQVETFGGIFGDRGLSIGGSPQFVEGDVYLLSLSEFNGTWTLRFMSYGVMVQRRMVTGQHVFTHLESSHELNIVVPDGSQIEPITTYSSSTVVPYLKKVALGTRAWSRGDAGEVANAGHDGVLKMDNMMGLDAAPPGCAYMTYTTTGNKIRWTRFDLSAAVSIKVQNGAPANVVTALQSSISSWKNVPGVNLASLVYGGNNPTASCSAGEVVTSGIPVGDAHIFLDDPCGEVDDLVGCNGTLAIAGPGFYLTTHDKNGENWHEAAIGFMVVNNGAPTCLTAIQYEQVITHELGHILGFGHHTGSTANMNASCCSPITSLDESCAFYSYGTGVANPLPVITSLNPNNANQGTNNLVVQINGTNFVTGGTLSSFGSGITTNSVVFVNSTQLTANISIASNATPGARNVTYTNPAPGGGQSNAVVFTVNQLPNPVPSLTSLSPNSADRGTSNLVVNISGNNLNVAGASIGFECCGITINSAQVISNTQAAMNISIDADAILGDRSFSYTNPAPGGGTSNPLSFTITQPPNPLPILSSISPNSGQQGSVVNITLTGTNFVSGASVQVSGTGVTVSNVTIASTTLITAQFTISAGAAIGARNVTVTNPAPGGGISGAQTFTVTEIFVNKQPTMNAINDVSFLHTAAEQVVNLSGISAGPGENQNLTVTAVAANPQLIQTLSVQYVSPQATGTLRFQNDRRMVGTTTIAVKVKDNGGTTNGGIDSLVRVFTVNVNLDTDLETENPDLPVDYDLLQNYPNPFNPSTIIPFNLPGRAFVTLGVYDVTGRLRERLLHQEMGAGRHEVTLDASSFGSGLYVVRLSSELGIKTRMILLVK